METPSLAAKLRDANSINRDVVEACENSADAPAIATGHENTSDLETTDASLEKVEGHHSVDRVRTIKNGKWLLLLLSIYSTSILYGLDTTIVADVQAPIIEAFGQDQKLAWIGVGFPLGSVAVILSVGKAYGIFNTKWMYITSIITFEVGSAICGGAPNMDALIVGRVIAGAGGAGIYLGALNIFTAVCSPSEQAVYLAIMGTIFGIATILGPVIGGAFATSSATWRWAFYINLVVAGVFSPAYLTSLPPLDPQPGVSPVNKFKQVDWLGTLLNGSIYATWVIALTFGGSQWAWTDGRTIAMFVLSGIFVVLFLLQQHFLIMTTHRQRIFPLEFLKSRTLSLLWLGTCTTSAAQFIVIYFIPLFFQFTTKDTALHAAVRLLPFITLWFVAMLFSGGALPKVGYYMPWSLASGILITIGSALMFTIDATTSAAKVYGYSILIAVGSGLTIQIAYSVGPLKVAINPAWGQVMIPDLIGFMNTAQIGAIVHALAISGAVFQNLAFRNLKSSLGPMGFTDAQLRQAISGLKSEVLLNSTAQTKSLAIEAIISAMDYVWILGVAGGGALVVAALFLKREKLNFR